DSTGYGGILYATEQGAFKCVTGTFLRGTGMVQEHVCSLPSCSQHGPARLRLDVGAGSELRRELAAMRVDLGEVNRGEPAVLHQDSTVDDRSFDAVATRGIHETVDIVVCRHPLRSIDVDQNQIGLFARLERA